MGVSGFEHIEMQNGPKLCDVEINGFNNSNERSEKDY